MTNSLELIIGASRDTQFGLVIAFGTGGKLVEVYKDTALALPPLNAINARRLIQKTKIYKALLGVRGMPPADLNELDNILINFSRLLTDFPEIQVYLLCW